MDAGGIVTCCSCCGLRREGAALARRQRICGADGLRLLSVLPGGLDFAGPGSTGRPQTSSVALTTAPHPRSDPAMVHANELGEIPVLMYHRILANSTTATDSTPEQFRAELERLAANHYVPITATELATAIDIPAGTHPVALTFDDSWPSQLSLGFGWKPNQRMRSRDSSRRRGAPSRVSPNRYVLP